MIITPEQVKAAFGKEEWDDEDSDRFRGYSYDALFRLYGYELLHSEEFGSYQGDAIAIFRDKKRPNNKWGLLMYGYGSCSGCDALQACDTNKEAADLANNFHNGIRWFRSPRALAKYVISREARESNWWSNDDEIVQAILEWVLFFYRPELKAKAEEDSNQRADISEAIESYIDDLKRSMK